MAPWQTFGVVVAALLFACANAYTVSINPHNVQCFYQDTTKINQRILFSFAVQTGGNFDIDYTVKDPTGSIIHSGEAEKEGEFTFNVDPVGEYAFCFSNTMSTFVQKLVTFDISIVGETPSRKPIEKDEVLSPIQNSIDQVRDLISKIQHSVFGYKTREQRNLSTTESTHDRIFWTTIIEVALIIAVAVGQIVVLRSFFTTKKGRAI